MPPATLPHLVITVGEPAGIGPDIVMSALTAPIPAAISVIGDIDVLRPRAERLKLDIDFVAADPNRATAAHTPGMIRIIQESCGGSVMPGKPDTRNVPGLLRSLDIATDLCLGGMADAMITAPVHKAVINDAGTPFQGHTEWIAERCGGVLPVMMLASPTLRVCLATTHMPLSAVPGNITRDRLTRTLRIMHRDISRLYALSSPVIGVLGLNPHAGEGGHLGHEEIETIEPVIGTLRDEGMELVGPLPADTAFTTQQLAHLDAVLAMYHDQGLPVVKHQGFGDVVNVTLGLPVIRTSVDHGTALDLAGTGAASDTSLRAAINLALDFATNKLALEGMAG